MTALAQVCKCFQKAHHLFAWQQHSLRGFGDEKSSAIFVSAVALGLAMFVPLKASAQGVTIYVGPSRLRCWLPGYAYYAPYPRYYGYSYQATVMPIQATATATAVRATALIGAIVDELLAELIGDGIAGIRAYRDDDHHLDCPPK